MGVKLTSGRFSTIDANENKLIDVLDGTADGDGVNYGQIKNLNGNVYTLHEGEDASNLDTFQHYYLSLDSGVTHVGTPVPVGADEIVAETIQRNAANQTLEQWIAADPANNAGNFVAVAANSLTYISLARDEGLLSNAIETKMEVATENGNNYHYDLLRFVQLNGRLVLQTDNLVDRLEQIGGQYPSATSASNTGFSQAFEVVQGSVWYFEDNLWLYEGTTPLAITSDSTTFSNRPQSTVSTWVRLHNINWNQNITYYQGDVVTFSSRFYTVIPTTIAGSSSNANPANDTTQWRLINPGVPDGDATGEILVWDNDDSQYRAVRLLINGVNTSGATEAENFILDGIIDNPATRATTRAWQETFLLRKVTVLPETTKASTLAPGTPVAGDSLYLTEAYTDSADSTVYNRGSYTYTGVSGTDGAWGATGGPLGAFSVVGTPVAGTTDVLKYTNANTLTWSADDGEDLAAIQGEVDAVELEVDAIQAHETTIDHRLDVLEAEVANLEQTYDGEYTWENNPTIDALLTDNRVDSQGNNPSQSDILSSEYNPDSNVLRWWIASTIEDATITEFINQGDAIGFSDGIETPIPFVAIGNGANATNTAKYIDFKLQQEETYESILEGYADDTEVIFETTLYFFNTANDNFNQADHDAGDHHRATPLTPGQLADLTELEAVASDRILAKDADGTIVGDQRLSTEQYTVLDNFEVKTAVTTVTSTIPDEDTRIVLDSYDDGGGSVDVGGWYWRQQEKNPSPGDSEAPIYNPTTWADLADRPDGGETDSNLWRQLIAEAETVDIAKFNVIRAGVGQVASTTVTIDDADLGDFFVAGYDSATGEVDVDNWAVFRAVSNPNNVTNNDVRFRIHSVTSSAGVPPDGAGAELVISHLSETATTTETVRTEDPSFKEDLDIIGNTSIGDENNTHNLTVTGNTTIGGDLTVTGTVVGLEGETIQNWPATYTADFTVNQGDYWEVKNRIYRRDGANVLIDDTDSLTNNLPLDTGAGSVWTNITSETVVANGPGLGLVTGDPVDGVTTYTVSTDTILNRAEVSVPSIKDQILRTGEVNSIVDFLGSAQANASDFVVNHDADENPIDGAISFVNSINNGTLVWTEVNRLRVHSSDVDAATFFNTFTESGRNILITYRNPDNTIDTTNWALFRTTSAVTTITNGLQLSVSTVSLGEYGGSIQAEPATVYVRNGAFLPDNVLAYAEAVPGSAVNFNLLGQIVFDLEQTGITTITAPYDETDPNRGQNTNTQIGTTGIPAAGLGNTATLNHQSPTTMAYLALQFNSVFDQVGGVTADNSAFLVNGVVGDFTYIQYTSTWNGESGIVFVDRVRTIAGPNAETEADERVGATTTRRYVGTGTVTQFIFNPGTAVASMTVPQV